jgi:hypothetical protein
MNRNAVFAQLQQAQAVAAIGRQILHWQGEGLWKPVWIVRSFETLTLIQIKARTPGELSTGADAQNAA